MRKTWASHHVATMTAEMANHVEFNNPESNFKTSHERMTDITMMPTSCSKWLLVISRRRTSFNQHLLSTAGRRHPDKVMGVNLVDLQ